MPNAWRAPCWTRAWPPASTWSPACAVSTAGRARSNPSAEFLLIIKTSRDLFPALRAEIEKLHPYEVPELLALPVVAGAENYLSWLAGQPARSRTMIALIFDMDGVIIDSNPMHRESWEAFNRRYGLETTEAMHQRMYGKRNDQIVRDFFGDEITAQ